MDRKLATQFKRMRVQIDEPRVGFDMWVAIWSNNGRGECVIGAPSLDELESRWSQITRTMLDRTRAQHVIVIHGELAESLKDAQTVAGSTGKEVKHT